MIRMPAHKQPAALVDLRAASAGNVIPTHISFSDGRCRHLKSQGTRAAAAEEAMLACEATNTPANLLAGDCSVIAEVRRKTSGGFEVVWR